MTKIQDAMERAADKIFENCGGKDKAVTDDQFSRGVAKSEGFAEGAKWAHSPEIIAMLEPEQLLANAAVRGLVEALGYYPKRCDEGAHFPCDCLVARTILEKFQKGGGE